MRIWFSHAVYFLPLLSFLTVFYRPALRSILCPLFSLLALYGLSCGQNLFCCFLFDDASEHLSFTSWPRSRFERKIKFDLSSYFCKSILLWPFRFTIVVGSPFGAWPIAILPCHQLLCVSLAVGLVSNFHWLWWWPLPLFGAGAVACPDLFFILGFLLRIFSKLDCATSALDFLTRILSSQKWPEKIRFGLLPSSLRVFISVFLSLRPAFGLDDILMGLSFTIRITPNWSWICWILNWLSRITAILSKLWFRIFLL